MLASTKKTIFVVVVFSLILMLSIGYSLLSRDLNVTGSSHIDSRWDIKITNIRVKNIVSAYGSGSNASSDVVLNEGCTTTTAPCNTTTATFEARLITPGDSITYEVTITNTGTLDGVVESINLVCSENDAITCTTSGLYRADKILKTNGTNTIDVTVTYNPETSTQPVNTNTTVTLTINYQQDLGQVMPSYDYVIGDVITYKGSNWRVINNSLDREDYVTLMKEVVLTGEEIGANYVTYGDTSRIDMSYYWSSTCHKTGTYGADVYSSTDTSGCEGHNDYEGSKIKEVVDNYMVSNNMFNDLKVIDGYKIRLITVEELKNNLGWVRGTATRASASGNNVPSWVIRSNYPPYNNGYWTMSPNPKASSNTYYVASDGLLTSYDRVCEIGYGLDFGVRPVINLLKSAIPQQS